MRRFRITEPMNLQVDPIVNKRVITKRAYQSRTHPKREMRATIARMTPATMIPIRAPDVILTWLSFKRSGRVSTAGGRDQDKRYKGAWETLKRRVTYRGRARKMHQRQDRYR